MPSASIRSKVNGINALVGMSRDDLASGDVVTLESVNAHTTYSWNIAFKPAGSTATFSGSPVAQNPGNFTVDKEGPYLIRLIADIGLPTESTQYVRLRWLTVFADLTLVAAGEGYGGAIPVPVDITPTGWSDQQNYNLQTLLSYIARVSASGRVLYVDSNAGTEGYADHTTVQAAIDAAAPSATVTTPWVVLVRPGLYTEDVTLKPFVAVVGWPGNPSGTDGQRAVVLRGSHTVTTTNAPDLVVVASLTLEMVQPGTAATLTKNGPGSLVAYRCNFEQNGSSGTQGPAFTMSRGAATLDACEVVAVAALSAGRAAITVPGGLNPATLYVRRSLVRGPTGVILNSSLNPDVVVEFTDTRIVSTGGAGATGITSDAESLLLEYCRVEAASGDALRIHPGAGVVADVAATIRWSYLTGPVEFDITGVSGTTSLLVGSSEYTAFLFPGGTPTTLTATTKSTSLFYDNTSSGLSSMNVQEAINEIAVLATLVQTLDEAYDGGIPNSGSGRTILADQGAVQILDAAFPADPPPAGNTDGRLEVVSAVSMGAVGFPEIEANPNPYGSGPMVRMGNRVVPNNIPFGVGTAWVQARSTGTPLFRNYNLRIQTESSNGGGAIGRLMLQGGDGYDNGAITPDAANVYIEAGSAFDPTANPGSLFLSPGRRTAGASGSFVLVRPAGSTPATLTASGAASDPIGVAGSVTFATNMGAITATFLAGDSRALCVAKLDALLGISAAEALGVITLTSDHLGPTAEVYFLSATAGVDAALGGFDGVPQVNGAYTSTILVEVTATQEISFGTTGVAGPLVYNADTGKLTVPGIIDPTAVVFEEATIPTTGATEGAVFVSDGSGGLILGELYYRPPSNGLPAVVGSGGGGPGSDTTAIHDNQANEISVITEKLVPVITDLLVIEDSASGNVKKRVQIGNLPFGGGTDPDAIHVNVAGEINGITLKAIPVAADILVIEDSAAAFAKKKIAFSSITATDTNAVHVNVAGEILLITEKSVPVLADLLIVEDSAAANAKKRVQFTNIIFGLPASSETLASKIEIATQAETNTGTDDARAITPLKLAVATNVIHSNVAGEIVGVTEKLVPVAADLVLIEDSAGANAKKRVQIANLIAGLPAASETVAGKIEIATQAETNTGTDDLRAVTPLKLAVATNVLHSNVAGEISGLTLKGTPVAADVFVIEDSAAAFSKKKIAFSSLSATDANAVHVNVAGEISGVTEKTTPVAADLLIIEDSAAGNVKKRLQVTNIVSGLPAASEILASKIEIATQTETNTGTDDVRAVTPLKLAVATNILHSNVANEISGLTAKTALVSTDILVIEDSEAGFVKKKVALSSLLESQVQAKTTAYVITTADQGSLFTNEGATAQVDFTLPAATAAGLGAYSFINQDSDGLRVIAGAGDTIQLAPNPASAMAGHIVPATTGCSITLVAINASEWVATQFTGVWTVN